MVSRSRSEHVVEEPRREQFLALGIRRRIDEDQARVGRPHHAEEEGHLPREGDITGFRLFRGTGVASRWLGSVPSIAGPVVQA